MPLFDEGCDSAKFLLIFVKNYTYKFKTATLMKKTAFLFAIVASLLLIMTDCSRKVSRISPDKQTDLSGRWNDTDSRLVAKEMMDDALNRPWREQFVKQNDGKKPVVIVGQVKNKTSEHIEPEVFIKDIEKEFINTGLVRVVQHGKFREKMREERADQQEFASPETMKKWGRELGADFMMFGSINSITDQYKNKKTVFYQVNLELADLETNEIVWIGEKEIKKFIQN